MRLHLASLVEDFRQHHAETAIVLHRGNRRYRTTYGALAELTGRFAAELEHSGIGHGERVVIWGENSAEWVATFFGCMLRGVLAVPLDAAGSSSFAERVIADVAPSMIIGDSVLLRTISSAAPHMIFSELEARLPKQPSFDVSSEVTTETPFQIVFTSGTTSDPKGIVHTHRNVLASLVPIEFEIAKYRRYERLVHPLRFLHTLPLSHVFGQFIGLWIPPLLAAEIHFYSQMEPARMVDVLKQERISVLVAVPRVIELLRSHLINRFPSLAKEIDAAQGVSVWKRWWRFRRVHHAFGLKFWALICGGASLPADLERFWSTLGFALIQGYGMTETAALVTLNHPFRIGRGTIGKALPRREVRLRDGEILVRGDMLSTATWQDGRMRPREGEWLATGDLAEENEAGELRFLGRKGEVIVLPSGMNVHPVDLEAALSQQAGVRGCVVVACKLTGAAEPVAVVLFSGSDSELQSAIDRANKQLASYQQIRHFLRWTDLDFPYTSTGKLLRRKVSQWACDSFDTQRRTVNAENNPHGDPLLQIIAGITNEAIRSGDDGQRLSEDLHLDSLGRVQLQSTLEQKFSIDLSDDAITNIATLGQLRRLIDDGPSPRFSLPAADQTPQRLTGRLPPMEMKPSSKILEEFERPNVAQSVHPRSTYPRWPWSWPVRLARILFIELIVRPLVWLLVHPRVIHESIELPEGPFLVIANHVTAYDGALALYALPFRLRRRVAIAMSGEMLLDLRHGRNQGGWLRDAFAPAGYWMLTALFNTFPLPRQSGFRKSFAHAGEALDRGYSVMIFPEGHRSSVGKLQPFRPGIGLLAHDSGVPALPIAFIGLGEMRAEGRWFRSGRLTIRVGESVPIDDAMGASDLTHMLEDAVRRLCSITAG